MYVLAFTLDNSPKVHYIVGPSRKSIKRFIPLAADYRLWHNGWIESKTEESWKTIGVQIAGQSAVIVY